MDEVSIDQQFKRLEEKVGQLVQRCQDLGNAKTELEARIRDFEEALENKNATEQHHSEEKGMILSKIDNLLNRLDQALDSS